MEGAPSNYTRGGVKCKKAVEVSQPSVKPLKFTQESTGNKYTFQWSQANEPYLQQLRSEHELDRLIGSVDNEYKTVRAVRTWAHNLWTHDGWNEPSQNDPLTILREAKAGANFRCVEYSIVIVGALTALGIPTRFLALKTEDCETRETGAGYVVAEAYLPKRQQWILVDGQWDATPFLDAQPLNAVEFQRAIARQPDQLQIETASDVDAAEYIEWIAPYLFYFDVPLDNRITSAHLPWGNGEPHLILVPRGAPHPTVFQQKWPIANTTYTHSASEFYPKPLAFNL